MSNIIVPSAALMSFSKLRSGIKLCIQAAAPKAIVYANWPLRYSIGETIALLKSSEDSNNVHAWIMKTSNGTLDDTKAGGYNPNWGVELDIWGFMGYSYGEDDESTQNIIEDETRLVATTLYLNRKTLGLDDLRGLRDVGLLRIDESDVKAFGEGLDCHVVQCKLSVTLSEDLRQ